MLCAKNTHQVTKLTSAEPGTHSVGLLFARAFVYALLIAGLTYLIMLEGYSRGTESKYNEQSLTEWLEVLLALLAGVCFLLVARLDTVLRPAAAMLAALCLMMCIREGDFLLDAYVFDGAWQVLVTVVLVTVSIWLWRQPHSVAESIRVFAQRPASGLLLGGFLVLFVFSRLFGREEFWLAVMGEGYMRVVKNVAEEGTELAGYALIAIAAIEFLFVSVFARGPTRR